MPAHWSMMRLRACAQVLNGFPFDSELFSKEDGVPLIRIRDLSNCQPETFFTGSYSERYIVKQGEVLIGMDGEFNIVEWSGEPALLNQRVCRIEPHSGVDGKYLSYLLQLPLNRINDLTYFTTVKHLSSLDLLQTLIPQPPPKEQQSIAVFLDRETARIDELLREQGLLLEDLGLKRQATITQAVTQGIDSKVTLRSSETPWIGDMPQHWGTRRLKQLSPEQTVGVVVNPSTYVDPAGTVPFLVGSNIAEQRFKLQQLRFISEESNALLQKTRLRSGDLVTVRVGAPGITAVIPPELDGCNCASVMITRQSPIFDSRWLAYAMNSRIGRAQVEVVQYGAAQEQFNISHAVDFVFPFPPHAEQQAIADHLDAQLAQIDALTEEVRASMALMRQHRAALITAAVTGKIDVRDHA